MVVRHLAVMLACPLILGALSSCRVRAKNVRSGLTAAASESVTVYADASSVLEPAYLGVGVQWDPQDPSVRDWTPEEWAMIQQRLDFMAPKIIRTMLNGIDYARVPAGGQPFYYWQGEDARGNNPKFDSQFSRLRRILTYAQKNNIEVILGEWIKHPAVAKSDDPLWTEMIANLLDRLINHEGFTCIRYINFINEPNGVWGIHEVADGPARWLLWSKGVRQLHEVLKARGLRDKVKIFGPGSTDADNWVDLTAQHLADVIDVYDIHKYPSDVDVSSANAESIFREKKADYQRLDPQGKGKPFVLGEVGLSDGKTEYDQNPRVAGFDYGVYMADMIAQSMRAGQAAIVLWNLDDALHRADAYDANSPQKIWGFWNSIGTPEEQKVRPWFLPVSQIIQSFPRGAQTIATTQAGMPKFRLAAARISAVTGHHLSFLIVNNQAQARSILLKVPAASTPLDFVRYQYFQNNQSTDAGGMLLSAERLNGVNLAAGLSLTLPGQGAIILSSQKAGGRPITLDLSTKIPPGSDIPEAKPSFVIEDEFDDWSKVAAHTDGFSFDSTNDSYFDSDKARIKTQGDTADEIIYELANMVSFAATVHGRKENKAPPEVLSFSVSTDQSTWTPVSVKAISTKAGALWSQQVLAPAATLPAGSTFLKISFIPQPKVDDLHSPQLSKIKVVSTLVDDLVDYSKMHSRGSFTIDTSNPDRFKGDSSRIKRASDDAQAVVYRYPEMRTFTISGFYCNQLSKKMSFAVSKDGKAYADIAVSNTRPEFMNRDDSAGQDWYGLNFYPAAPLPAGTSYLRIMLNPGEAVWEPQLSKVIITP